MIMHESSFLKSSHNYMHVFIIALEFASSLVFKSPLVQKSFSAFSSLIYD